MRNIRQTFFLLCWAAWPVLGMAQLSDFQVFIQASIRRDYNEALELLYRQSGLELQRNGWLDRETMFLADSLRQSRVRLLPEAQRGLLRAQALLAQQQDSLRNFWLDQAAESALFFQGTLRDSLLTVLPPAILARRAQVPDPYWEELAGALLEIIPDDRQGWARWLDAWQVLDYVLIQMPVIHPEKSGDADRLRTTLQAFLFEHAPDCELLRAREQERVRLAFVTPAENARLFLQLDAQDCPSTPLEDTVRRRVTKLAPTPYLLLRAAESYLQEDVFWEAQRLLLQAIRLEEEERFKALLELRLAGLYAIRRSFRSARLHIRQADELYPAWGRPSLVMADLVESSGSICATDKQERWALTFLAMDYCEEAARKNPDLEAEVAARMRSLREKVPDADELTFLGLKAGDRIPVTCWINEAAVVR